jgi:ATP-dependent RNA helicase RhlE
MKATVSASLLRSKAQQNSSHMEEIKVPVIEHQFADFALSQAIKDNVAGRGYTEPTPIQDKIIPFALEGKDVIGLANTGTGKTAAFLLPILNRLTKNRDERALIMAPTRELAEQIQQECRAFSVKLGIYSTLCIGGANIRSQMGQLERHPNIVIGTPGRLQDLAERRSLHFSEFQIVVLDEVDRMLDMGFIHDMKKILGELPADRQTLFFSATMNNEAERLAQQFLHEPVKISVIQRETTSNIEQTFVQTFSPVEKMRHLQDLLNEVLPNDGKVIVFGRTQHGVDKLVRTLEDSGHDVVSMHGRKTQAARQKALRQFKKSEARILVATDVAARGIDVQDITHVVNYELPATYDDYVHRIGRTGRAERKGIAITYHE